MNRRGFIGLFAGALSAATLDPERALWIPGAKTISIPPMNDFRRQLAIAFDVPEVWLGAGPHLDWRRAGPRFLDAAAALKSALAQLAEVA